MIPNDFWNHFFLHFFVFGEFPKPRKFLFEKYFFQKVLEGTILNVFKMGPVLNENKVDTVKHLDGGGSSTRLAIHRFNINQ